MLVPGLLQVDASQGAGGVGGWQGTLVRPLPDPAMGIQRLLGSQKVLSPMSGPQSQSSPRSIGALTRSPSALPQPFFYLF